MALSEYEKAQLALLQQQVEATKENTAALHALRKPPAEDHAESLQRQTDAMAWRKGGPPQDIREFTGTARAFDKEGGDAIEVRITARVAWRPEGRGAAGSKIFEVTDDPAPVVAFLEQEWIRTHAEFLGDCEKSPAHRLEAQKEKEIFVGRALWWRFRVRLHQALIGKDPAKVGHLVTWDEPLPSVATDEAAE